MATTKLAIDFDSAYTNIYMIGSGMVLSEPTVAAVEDGERGAIKAIGEEASKLIGKTGKNTTIVFPVFEGEVVNERVATGVLGGFLKKLGLGGVFADITAIFSVPCGADYNMLESYRRTARAAGIAKVCFAETPILSALGQRIPFTDSKPCFVVDMAGGTTCIAALSLDGIIAGVSVNFGGNKISADLIDYIAERFGLQVGLLTAEKLKTEIGSLETGDGLSCVINGRDISTGSPRALSVKAYEIAEPIKRYFDKIAEITMEVLKKLPPEVSAEIRHSGLYLSGATSCIYGLSDYYESKFGMHVHVAENGLTATALGGGIALADKNLLKKVALDCK